MTYLLDTCTLSDARRRHPAVVSFLRSIPSLDVFMSAVTVGEISRGVALKEARDPRGAAALRVWLTELRREFASRILAVDEHVGLEWGLLMAQRPRPTLDTLIAATAVVHGMAIVTRNERDFHDVGVPVLNPWSHAH